MLHRQLRPNGLLYPPVNDYLDTERGVAPAVARARRRKEEMRRRTEERERGRRAA